MQSNELSESDYVRAKFIQSVAGFLYTYACETLLSCIGSPVFQGLVDLLGGRLQICGKQVLESYLFSTYKAVCSLFRKKVKSAKPG